MDLKTILGTAILLVHVVACNDEAVGEQRAVVGSPQGDYVAVGKAEVVVGLTLSSGRREVRLSPYSISLKPVSVSEYRACIDAGACSEPAWSERLCSNTNSGVMGATFAQADGKADAAEMPLTCASPQQMRSYCSWIGARLPTAAEWLLAARGKEPQRFAWGNEPPTCDVHWRTDLQSETCCDGACSELAPLQGRRFDSQRMADVLVTDLEVFAAHPAESYLGCAAGNGVCFVGGMAPGAMDFLGAGNQTEAREPRQVPAAFRCVWGEES